MTEKRYKGNKYVQCYCEKNVDVLVGAKMYGVVNPIAFIGSITLMLWIVFSNVDIAIKVGAVVLFGVSWIIGISTDYTTTNKHMLKEGHSKLCSCKIARLVMIYGSLWSEFKVMKEKDDGKRLWW